MMQFIPTFAYAASYGLDNDIYASISEVAHRAEEEAAVPPPVSAWAETLELLFDDFAIRTAMLLDGRGAPPPSSVGYELLSENREIIAEAEMAWEAEKVVWLCLNKPPQ